MMQFTESASLPMHPNGPLVLRPDAAASGKKPPLHRARSAWPAGASMSTTTKSMGIGGGSSSTVMNSASCMEQLLVHCADAIDRNDATLAHQIFWVLNTIAPPDGDSTQRLASAFLRALISRASRIGLSSGPTTDQQEWSNFLHHRFSPLDLAAFVDLTPYHRFGFSAANSAIADAVDGFPSVHVVDLGTTHCMQIPTLIDTLATRHNNGTRPPFLRLTVPDYSPLLLLDLSYEELGSRLVNFARSRNVGMEFRVVSSGPTNGFQTLIEKLRIDKLISSTTTTTTTTQDEALVVNCQMSLRYVPDESSTVGPVSVRSMFLNNLRSLEPTVVTLVDEDVDLASADVVGRIRSAFNYLWIPYDAVDTFLPRGSEQRRWYEAGICWKIENVIGQEGLGRTERSETRGRWAQRMRSSGFRGVGFGEEAAGEVKGMLGEHAAGWGMKKELEEDQDQDQLVLTWKGHNVVFASAWVSV